ncbi:MAG: hydroxyisourate hydrolase [Pseudomonadota bacterium]
MSQITTHVLDTARGCPADGLAIQLFERHGDEWVLRGDGVTNSDGRIGDLLPPETILAAGEYRMHFATGPYLSLHAAALSETEDSAPFYPYVDVVFHLRDGGEHYHIPLLLSPYSYSTYRGS